MSNNGLRRSGQNWRDYEDDPQAATPQDDPLSELARLIEEDPFADFDQGRRAAPAQRPAENQYANLGWPWTDETAQQADASPQDGGAEYAGYDGEWETAPDGGEYAAPAETGEHALYEGYDDRAPADWQGDDVYAQSHAAEPQLYGYDEYGQAQRLDQAGAQGELDYDEGAPHYDETGHMAPLSPAGRGRRAGRTAMFGGLALLALIGGVGAVAYREMSPSTADGPPIMVAADPQPVKVKPDNPGGTQVPNQDKIVFDRANGITGSGKTEERIVSREEPVEEVALRETVSAAPEPGAAADAPKRVRTVVVKPDGTIVTEAPAATPRPERVAALRETGNKPGPVTLYDAGEAATPTASTGGIAATAPEPSVGQPQPEPAIPAAAAAPAETTAANGVPVPPSRPAGAAAQPASRTPAQPFVPPSAAEERASAANAGRPMQLVPQPSAGAAAEAVQPTQMAAAPSRGQDAAALVQSGQQTTPAQTASVPSGGELAAGGYVVQVSSTRSESDAQNVAARIKSQYGNVLSGYETGVQRADLGDRGVYYRVAVGPLTDSSSAASLCGRLKTAGLDCFIRRN